MNVTTRRLTPDEIVIRCHRRRNATVKNSLKFHN